MNSNYEKTLDENFDKALSLCLSDYSYSDLINFLKNGNIPEKQYAALTLDEIKSQDDALVFLSNLTGCDGKIREAVAQKFSEFVLNPVYRKYFSNYPEIFAKATIDINANISRMVIEGLSLMVEYEEFASEYTKKIIDYIKESFDGLDKIIYKDKKYTINKQLFKLYWCLEALSSYFKFTDENILYSILERSSKISEYTIREKTAQILSNIDSPKFKKLREHLSTDENYYVKKLL